MDVESATSAPRAGDGPTLRFMRLGVGLLALYLVAALVADGEFWPFSRFPMFSRPRPWSRALVVELQEPVPDEALVECWESELPGKVFPLNRKKLSQDDLSALVSTFEGPPDAQQTATLAQYFERARQSRRLVLYRVHGRLRRDKTVRERFVPLALIDAQGARALNAPAQSEGGIQ